MLHKFFEPGDWFAPKKIGYGAGFPIAWQGWALLAIHLAITLGCISLILTGDFVLTVLGAIGMLGSTLALIPIVKARTKGGWKMRP